MFNSTFTVGASASGTQERNIGLSYSIDLEKVANQCLPIAGPVMGLAGDLGLADIVLDGINGLNVAKNVNIYGSSGPTIPTFTSDNGSWTLNGTAIIPNPDADKPGQPKTITISLDSPMTLTGSITYSPSTNDPQAPGTASVTGTAISKAGDKYLVYLTGSTLILGKTIQLSLSGTMTQITASKDALQLGFAPKLTLGGSLNTDYTHLNFSSDILNVDSTTLPKDQVPTFFSLHPDGTPLKFNALIFQSSAQPGATSPRGGMACTRFRRHRVRCFDGTGGESWKGGSLHASSSLRLACG